MKFSNITIVGVGLIGGSFALAARRAGLAERITGWDPNPESLERAFASGMIDAIASDPTPDSNDECDVGSASGDASEWDTDLVVLAAPVAGILNFLESQGKVLRPGTLVTDVGSTKRAICGSAEKLSAGVHFVGGHPMAGSHEVGSEFARADMFAGASYAVVPTSRSSDEAVRTIQDVASGIGAHPIIMNAAEHDRAVALVSHAPQLLSTALALAALNNGKSSTTAMAGPGFTSAIRLAASRWSIWKDICRTNSDEVSRALTLVARELESLKTALEAGN
ncbi:MAG TPA: prephenate dehydrogenase/arogenate dehydrogenase family protein, partial [Blastocatellia bacterium]|nr:prephenate dehydrogenase/arogenate dehydrogenase family protein [Blastocatellia bacterium]